MTIFAPDYVPNGSRVLITLTIREKPENPFETLQKDLDAAQKAFYFSVTKWPLKVIDEERPTCLRKFNCHNIPETCHNANNVKDDDFECHKSIWNAQIIVQDQVSGIRSIVQAADQSDEELYIIEDKDLLIGSTENVSIKIRHSCCLEQVVLNITDVAGNSDLCYASINLAIVSSMPCSELVLLCMTFFAFHIRYLL